MKLVETERPGLARDLESGALVNTNMDALKAYKARKSNIGKTEERLNKLEGQINTLMGMMQQLIDKVGK